MMEPPSPKEPTQLPDESTFSPSRSSKKLFEPSEFLKSLRTFRFSAVVPYRQALSSNLYGHTTVKLLLFFGLFPLVVSLIASQTGFVKGLEQTAWVLGIYYASIWGVVLHNLIRPMQFSWGTTLKCILFTVFIGIPILLLAQRIPLFRLLYTATEGGLFPRLIGSVLAVGVLEEVCKALPIYLFLLRPGKLSDPLTSAFYGAMSGLGFAISEGVVYSVLYAMGLAEGEIGLGAYVLTNTIRFVSLPLFHAIWAGIVGYFLGLAAINPSRRAAIIFIGVVIAAVLHGLYDTFAGSLLGLAIMAFSILLFVAYLRYSQEMVEEARRAEFAVTSLENSRKRDRDGMGSNMAMESNAEMSSTSAQLGRWRGTEQEDCITLAQTGNLEAIATLVHRSLQVEGANVQTNFKDGCLLILLESPQLPGPVIAAQICQSLQPLTVDFIETVRIYGRTIGNKAPIWTQELTWKQVKNSLQNPE